MIMNNQLAQEINNYIDYLGSLGLNVTVHGRGISGLLEHNIHRNPFCTLIKTSDDAWKKCIACQQRVLGESKRGKIFGMCHAGMEEYVYFVSAKTFVSVSGYGINRERAAARMKRAAEEFLLDERELEALYEADLKHSPEPEGRLDTLIKPLCRMIELLTMTAAETVGAGGGRLVDSILSYVQRNFMENLTVRDIARACACSPSAVSHLFKAEMGLPLKEYVNRLRIDQAKKLLESTHAPITAVAMMCGFANSSYFATAFKKAEGMTPGEYRGKG